MDNPTGQDIIRRLKHIMEHPFDHPFPVIQQANALLCQIFSGQIL